MDYLFDMVNDKYDDALCLVCKPIPCIGTKLHRKVVSVSKNGGKIKRVFLALNIGSSGDSSTYIAHGSLKGDHWTLIVADVENNLTNYGDSLGWDVPNNLEAVVKENIAFLQAKTGLTFHVAINNSDIVVLHHPSGGNHKCHTKCRVHFYPLQTCSHICGVIVLCMVALMAQSWQNWLYWDRGIAPPLLLNPSLHNDYLRLKGTVRSKYKLDLYYVIFHADFKTAFGFCIRYLLREILANQLAKNMH